MQKIHIYTLLFIAILTAHLTATQATASASREIQLDTIQESASFTSWHDTRRITTQQAIGDQVLQSHELDIPDPILDIMVDYTLSTTLDDSQLLEEIIHEQLTDKPHQIYNLCITGSFIQAHPQYRNFKSCFILLNKEKNDEFTYFFKNYTFTNSYFAPFCIENSGKVFSIECYATYLKTCTLSHLHLRLLDFSRESTLANCLIEDTIVEQFNIQGSTVRNTTFRNTRYESFCILLYESEDSSMEYESNQDRDDFAQEDFDKDDFLLRIADSTIAEHTVFDNCKLNAFFINSTFDKLHVNATRFPHIDIRYCTFSQANFEDSSFGELQCGVLGQFVPVQSTIFRQCTFHHQTIQNAKFENTQFIDCKLEESLTEAQFIGTTLDEKTLRKSYPEPVSLLTIILARYLTQLKK